MILSSSDTIEVVLGEAKTTNDCPYTVGYFDSGATPAGGPLLGNTNGTTTVTPVTAPASGYTRQVFEFTLFNADTVSHAVTVQYNNGSTTYKIIKGTLLAGETLAYSAHTGWRVLDSSGNLKTIAAPDKVHGTTTNDDASAGYVGEIVSSSVASGSAVTLVHDTDTNVTSISLTAGDWQAWGQVSFGVPGGVTPTNFWGAPNTTSATLPTAPNGGAFMAEAASYVAGNTVLRSVGQRRYSLSSTTTVYLVAKAGNTTNADTVTAYGFLGARRVR